MAKRFGKKLRVVIQTLYVLDGGDLFRVAGGAGEQRDEPWSNKPSCQGFCVSNGVNQNCASQAGQC